MQEPDITIYVSVMEEIKRRTSVIHSFLKGSSNALFRATNIESIYLQIRMILELIALASIAANKPIFEENQKKFHKHWNPVSILRDIEKLNPNYYPEPILGIPSRTENVTHDLVAIQDGFLTKTDLISIHGKSGNILHARNPYNEHFPYDAYEKEIPQILAKIKCLLNCHQIRLLDEHNFFYLVHMKEEGDDHVHYYKFEAVKGQQRNPARRPKGRS